MAVLLLIVPNDIDVVLVILHLIFQHTQHLFFVLHCPNRRLQFFDFVLFCDILSRDLLLRVRQRDIISADADLCDKIESQRHNEDDD